MATVMGVAMTHLGAEKLRRVPRDDVDALIILLANDIVNADAEKAAAAESSLDVGRPRSLLHPEGTVALLTLLRSVGYGEKVFDRARGHHALRNVGALDPQAVSPSSAEPGAATSAVWRHLP